MTVSHIGKAGGIQGEKGKQRVINKVWRDPVHSYGSRREQRPTRKGEKLLAATDGKRKGSSQQLRGRR